MKMNFVELFNRHLNRSCLVYMISLRFSGTKFLINLRRQFGVRKIFRAQLFVFKITISKIRNLCLRLLFY